jgi:hypothetical protein
MLLMFLLLGQRDNRGVNDECLFWDWGEGIGRGLGGSWGKCGWLDVVTVGPIKL